MAKRRGGAPITDEELADAKELLRMLLDKCGREMSHAERSLSKLRGELDSTYEVFWSQLGRMNVFRQEELRVRLKAAERKATEYEMEIAGLRRSYDRMNREYSRLCK